MTIAEFRALLSPYADDDEVVFVDSQLFVCAVTSVAKDHCTKRQNADGSVTMPLAVYLDEGVRGTPRVMGGNPLGENPFGG